MPDRPARGHLGERSRRIWALVLLTATVGVVLQGQPGVPAAADTTLRVDGPVRAVVPDTGVLQVDGGNRYLDVIELRPTGMTVVNELSLEDYVAGVAEMPARWPSAALEAQAIAARTYAWWSIEAGSFDGYDICATVACQVFRGVEQVADGGERWQQAVTSTAGQVLVTAAGGPVLARYFSTSGGRTYDNDVVFPSSGARPELVGIDDPYDAVSPYHRWTVEFTREEFDAVLARGDTLRAAVPVATVERLGPVDAHDAELRVTGQDGTEVVVTALAFRDFVSRLAPDTYPDRFPTARADGLRPLPTTVPSSRFDVEVAADTVTIRGQGWGHGVGMGQYGALGRAEAGQDARTILAAYYGGTEPTRPAGLPERIRVGLREADEVTVTADRPFDLLGPDGPLVEGTLGTWRFTRAGGGWDVAAPVGDELELDVAATRVVDAGTFADAVAVEVVVNKPVQLALQVRAVDGSPVLERPLGVVDAGTHEAVWRFVTDAGVPVDAGTYDVALVGTDAAGTTGGRGVEVEVSAADVAEAEAAVGSSDPDDDGRAAAPGRIPTPIVAAGLALPIALLLLVLAARQGRP
jgi:SpoIID/LytB domain protein